MTTKKATPKKAPTKKAVTKKVTEIKTTKEDLIKAELTKNLIDKINDLKLSKLSKHYANECINLRSEQIINLTIYFTPDEK